MLRFDDIAQWPRTMIIAHRGAGHTEPSSTVRENTLEAFETAIATGADAIEFDLRRTRNGVIIVHHDAEIAGLKWLIGEMSWDEVMEAAQKLGYAIPTFEETLKACTGKIALDIELKETGYEDEIVAITRRYYDLAHVAFTSFHEMAVKRIKESESQAIVGLLLGDQPPIGAKRRLDELLPRKLIVSCDPDFVAPNWRYLKWLGRRKNIYGGLPIITWTVDDIAYSEKLIRNKIAGIITNTPDRLLPLVHPTGNH